jgi:hypothetical protein
MQHAKRRAFCPLVIRDPSRTSYELSSLNEEKTKEAADEFKKRLCSGGMTIQESPLTAWDGAKIRLASSGSFQLQLPETDTWVDWEELQNVRGPLRRAVALIFRVA